MKVNFAACTVVFDGYERCSEKNYKSSRISTQQPNVNVLSRKKWQVISYGGKIFGATLEVRPCWLSFYHNILKKIETQL